MPSTYLPRREAELDLWLANFAGLIAGNPAKYHRTAGEALQITQAFEAWHSAYLLASSPATRTAPAIVAKDEARRAALIVARRLAAAIRADAGIDDELKLGLGLQPPHFHPSNTPHPAPGTYPLLMPTAMSVGSQTIRAVDSASPARRARPKGTIGLLVFRTVEDGPAADPARAQFLALATTSAVESRFNQSDHGKTATYFARWVNARGDPGPWGPAASMPIAA